MDGLSYNSKLRMIYLQQHHNALAFDVYDCNFTDEEKRANMLHPEVRRSLITTRLSSLFLLSFIHVYKDLICTQ